MKFYPRIAGFWGCSGLQKKNEIPQQGRDSLYFQVFPGHFYCMRGSSLVEVTGHDNGANLAVTFLIRMSSKEFVWSSHMTEYG